MLATAAVPELVAGQVSAGTTLGGSLISAKPGLERSRSGRSPGSVASGTEVAQTARAARDKR